MGVKPIVLTVPETMQSVYTESWGRVGNLRGYLRILSTALGDMCKVWRYTQGMMGVQGRDTDPSFGGRRSQGNLCAGVSSALY